MTRRVLIAALLLCGACKGGSPTTNSSGTGAPTGAVPGVTMDQIPGHGTVTQDNSLKEPPRLGAAEGYLRSYLQIFGGVTALAAQKDLTSVSGANIFDNWDAYLGVLGLPNYQIDLPRLTMTNALMIATFERLGEALCNRAMEKDILSGAVPLGSRMVYDFDISPVTPTLAQFTANFDVLHRTFLSYPVAMAPTDRVNRFYHLFQSVVANHTQTSRFSAQQEGWAAMCNALIRHPEYHLY